MPKTEKCGRCGWFDGKRFHVCFVPTNTTPIQREVEYEERSRTSVGTQSRSHRQAISDANRERWRTVNLERDLKIVERYAEGDIGYTGLAEEFGVSRSTIVNVMKNANAAGVIQTRSPGTNIKNGG